MNKYIQRGAWVANVLQIIFIAVLFIRHPSSEIELFLLFTSPVLNILALYSTIDREEIDLRRQVRKATLRKQLLDLENPGV